MACSFTSTAGTRNHTGQCRSCPRSKRILIPLHYRLLARLCQHLHRRICENPESGSSRRPDCRCLRGSGTNHVPLRHHPIGPKPFGCVECHSQAERTIVSRSYCGCQPRTVRALVLSAQIATGSPGRRLVYFTGMSTPLTWRARSIISCTEAPWPVPRLTIS